MVTYVVRGPYITKFTFLASEVVTYLCIDMSATPNSPIQMIISGKSFLNGYIHHNRNLGSKCYVSGFSGSSSALICQQLPFHSFRGGFMKNPLLVVAYIIIGNYIPNSCFQLQQFLLCFDMSFNQSVSPIHTDYCIVL